MLRGFCFNMRLCLILQYFHVNTIEHLDVAIVGFNILDSDFGTIESYHAIFFCNIEFQISECF